MDQRSQTMERDSESCPTQVHSPFLWLPEVKECSGKASVITSPAPKYIPAADV